METDTEPTGLLARLRPVRTVDELWPEQRRVAALERVFATDRTARPPRRHSRRTATVSVLAGALVLTGVGAATAGGVLPKAFTDSISFWSTETTGGVRVDTAQRVAQLPGPDGRVLSVWAAESDDGTLCVSPLFEEPGALDRPAPAAFDLAGGVCPRAEHRDAPFAASIGGSAGGGSLHTMWGPAGAATRAELLLPDGTVRPALITMGMFFCWYEADDTVAAPVLTGYDAAGQSVGTHQLPNLRHPGPPR